MRNPTAMMLFLEKHAQAALINKYKPIAMTMGHTIDAAIRGTAAHLSRQAQEQEPHQKQ